MNELNEFLKLVAEGKKNTPSGRLKFTFQQYEYNMQEDKNAKY